MKTSISIFLLGVVFCISPFVQAQISGELRSASDSNSDCKSSGSGSSSNSDNSSSSTDDYSSSSDNSDYSSGDNYAFSGGGGGGSMLPFPFVNAQKRVLSRRTELKRIVSLEVMAPAGLNLQDYLVFSPEIRANWGIFSGSFRHFNIIEPGIEGPDGWRTFDIDFLQFNLINSRPVRMRVGTGITVEDYKNEAFHEYVAGMDLFMLKEKVFIAQEVRISTDYCGCPAQRKEYNAGVNFLVLDKPHFRIYNTYNYLTQLYYDQVKVWSIGGGLRFMILR